MVMQPIEPSTSAPTTSLARAPRSIIDWIIELGRLDVEIDSKDMPAPAPER